METLKNNVETLIDNSHYDKACNLVAESFNLEFKAEFLENGLHFQGDKDKRDIYNITLKRGVRKYSFKFGQSIAKGSNEPTLYDVLACLQKYEVGTFEDFCDEFGYDNDSRNALKTYKAVVKEYDKMCSLFNSDELEVLQLIS